MDRPSPDGLDARAGYAYKFRPTQAFLQTQWELRYLILSGGLLSVYKNERDVFAPSRATIDIRVRPSARTSTPVAPLALSADGGSAPSSPCRVTAGKV